MSKIRLNGTSSGYTELAPPAAAGSNTITLPSSNGSANQFLKNGSTAGTLGWSSMVETATGVGIGTTSPGQKLVVSQNGAQGLELNPDSATAFILAGYNRSTSQYINLDYQADNHIFRNGTSERARITSGGYFKASNSGTYVGSTANYHEFYQTNNTPTLNLFAENASYTSRVIDAVTSRTANSAYSFFIAESGSYADFEFNLRGDGQGYADGSWNGGGADYAEYFEWEDGNPDAEDRRGYPVALVGNKIKIAEDGDTIIGIVSAAPVVLGDAAWNHWSGKYLKDEFGGYLLDENGDRQLNPDYDPTQPYVPREDRPEWSPIGLMGKLRLRKGQPVAANWLKLRDISATVEEWLVR